MPLFNIIKHHPLSKSDQGNNLADDATASQLYLTSATFLEECLHLFRSPDDGFCEPLRSSQNADQLKIGLEKAIFSPVTVKYN